MNKGLQTSSKQPKVLSSLEEYAEFVEKLKADVIVTKHKELYIRGKKIAVIKKKKVPE